VTAAVAAEATARAAADAAEATARTTAATAALAAANATYAALVSTRQVQGTPGTSRNWRGWQKAVARARAGISPAHLFCIGDSTFAGVGGSNSLLDAEPSRMRAALAQTLGMTCLSGWDCQDGQNTNAQRGFTAGTGWATLANNYGGFANQVTANGVFYGNGVTTGSLDYTPPDGRVWDTAEIITLANPATFTMQAGAGAATTFTQTATTSGRGRFKFNSPSRAAQTLKIFNTSAGNLWIGYVICYDSLNPGVVYVSNLAHSGSATPNWFNDAGVGPLSVITNTMTPDAFVTNLVANDTAPANADKTTASQYQTNYQAFATRAASLGQSVMALVAPQYDPAGAAAFADHSAHDTALYAMAAASGIEINDYSKRWGLFSAYTADFGAYPHTNTLSYAVKGTASAQILADVLRA
jgi:hypothetical protein